MITKEDVLRYAQERYGTLPEHPWAKYPSIIVLRHGTSGEGKWYGLLLPVPPAKLGLPREASVWVLNVKCEPALGDALRDGETILPAYHMNKEHWISLVLDSAISANQVLDLLDMSYQLTR